MTTITYTSRLHLHHFGSFLGTFATKPTEVSKSLLLPSQWSPLTVAEKFVRVEWRLMWLACMEGVIARLSLLARLGSSWLISSTRLVVPAWLKSIAFFSCSTRLAIRFDSTNWLRELNRATPKSLGRGRRLGWGLTQIWLESIGENSNQTGIRDNTSGEARQRIDRGEFHEQRPRRVEGMIGLDDGWAPIDGSSTG